jgi:hypothetical protein|tara:strand:+ start:3979 stop:4218 length:240 start_codon:yes stop_codon:yes gene_type:complete
MLLYLEKDLDRAYRLDCKARTKANEPWITREQFRSLYEDLISLHLQKAEQENILMDDLPDWVLDSIDGMLEGTLNLDKE